MKTRNCIVVMFLSILVFIVVFNISTCNATPELITAEESIVNVRTFEGNPNLQISCQNGMQTDLNGPEWKHKYYYEIVRSDQPGVPDKWRVNAVSGEIELVFKTSSNPSLDEPSDTTLKNQAKSVAEAYALSKYAGFNTVDFSFNRDFWIIGGWSFVWIRHTYYNALTLNRVEVNVRPDMSIGIYSTSRYPLPNLQAPSISSAQAIQYAADALGISTVTWNTTPVLTATPDGYLYDLEVAGTDASDIIKGALVQVNGDTGEVISIQYHGMTPPNIANLKKSNDKAESATKKSVVRSKKKTHIKSKVNKVNNPSKKPARLNKLINKAMPSK